MHDRDVPGEKDCTDSCARRALCGVTLSCGGTTNRKVIFGAAETKLDEREEMILHELLTLDPYIVITYGQ